MDGEAWLIGCLADWLIKRCGALPHAPTGVAGPRPFVLPAPPARLRRAKGQWRASKAPQFAGCPFSAEAVSPPPTLPPSPVLGVSGSSLIAAGVLGESLGNGTPKNSASILQHTLA